VAYAGKTGEARRLRPVRNSAPRVPLTTPSKSSRPIGALTTGIAIGLLVGAGVALLFAPQAGSETRHDLRRGLKRARRRGRDSWDDLRDELRHARHVLLRARRRRHLASEIGEAVAD
jgi:gas vesicle protein